MSRPWLGPAGRTDRRTLPVRNVDQLRAAIDSGTTADKVPFPDPAAVPLGTDAEAGGSPPSPTEVSMDATAQRGAVRRRAGRRLADETGIWVYAIAALFVSGAILTVGYLS